MLGSFYGGLYFLIQGNILVLSPEMLLAFSFGGGLEYIFVESYMIMYENTNYYAL